MANYTIQNNDGETYDLITGEDKFNYSISEWTPRADSTERFGVDGIKFTGDGLVSSREINFNWGAAATSDSQFRQASNEILSILTPDKKPFYLIDTDNDLRIEVRSTGYGTPFADGLAFRYSDANIKFRTASPHWEDNTLQTASGILYNGDTLTVNNDGYADCYPVIYATCLASPSINNFMIENLDYSGNFIEITNYSFSLNSEMIISSVDGSITLNGVDAVAGLTLGGFIRLRRGTNRLQYTSDDDPIRLIVEYRRRYYY